MRRGSSSPSTRLRGACSARTWRLSSRRPCKASCMTAPARPPHSAPAPWRARPGRPRTSRTPGSAATSRSSPRVSGWGIPEARSRWRTSRASGRLPAARCRPRSGVTSWGRPSRTCRSRPSRRRRSPARSSAAAGRTRTRSPPGEILLGPGHRRPVAPYPLNRLDDLVGETLEGIALGSVERLARRRLALFTWAALASAEAGRRSGLDRFERVEAVLAERDRALRLVDQHPAFVRGQHADRELEAVQLLLECVRPRGLDFLQRRLEVVHLDDHLLRPPDHAKLLRRER